MFGIGGLSNSNSQPNSFAAAAPTPQAALAAVSHSNEADISTLKPTATPSPTTVPASPTPEPAPPTGQTIKSGNLRSEPRIVPETVIGQVCASDTLDFLSLQTVDESLWYRVRVTGRAKDCGSRQAAVGSEGWVSSILVSAPSYAVEEYAQAARITLPTAIVQPTATPKPTAAPKPTAVPKPAVAPSTGGTRVGAVCRDGTRSSATGRGACSHHGGVAYWLYR